MTDEQWVELNGSDDETWYRRVQSDFGLDTRPKKSARFVKLRKSSAPFDHPDGSSAVLGIANPE